MPRASSPADAAASTLLTALASVEGELLEVLRSLDLLPKATSERQRLREPDRLPREKLEALSMKLRDTLPRGMLHMVSRRSGVDETVILAAAVEQLRLVASFAFSDGGAVEENVRAVELFVRNGGGEMFAIA